jgi:hypothetical protein
MNRQNLKFTITNSYRLVLKWPDHYDLPIRPADTGKTYQPQKCNLDQTKTSGVAPRDVPR